MITWHNPVTNPPQQAKSVLLAVIGETETSEGFLIGGQWTYSDGHDVDAAKVYAWTELPACPAIPPATLKPLRVRSVRLKGGRE